MQNLRRPKTSYDLYGAHPPGSSYGVTAYVPTSSPPPRPPTTCSGRNTPLQRPTTRQSLVAENGTQTKEEQQLNNHPYSGSMDPVNRHYYFREWCRNPPKPQMPINRSGRMGSSWRHVKTTFNPHGSHIAFIDGIVKEEENFFFPPELMYRTPNFLSIVPERRCITPALVAPTLKQSKYETSYNNKAKQGFRYWYQDSKPIDYSTKSSFGAKSQWLGVAGVCLPATNSNYYKQ